jgi:hypothetical protein
VFAVTNATSPTSLTSFECCGYWLRHTMLICAGQAGRDFLHKLRAVAAILRLPANPIAGNAVRDRLRYTMHTSRSNRMCGIAGGTNPNSLPIHFIMLFWVTPCITKIKWNWLR